MDTGMMEWWKNGKMNERIRGTPIFQNSTIPPFQSLLFQSSNFPVFTYSRIPLFQCSSSLLIPRFHHSNLPLFQSSNSSFHFLFSSIALTALAISRLNSPTASLRAATEPSVDFSFALRITRDSLTTATFLSAPSITDQRANN